MRTTVEAVYEQGVLRLLKALPLAEGARVEVIVDTVEPVGENKSPTKILATIAAMPLEAQEEPFSNQDHDQILYGDKGAR